VVVTAGSFGFHADLGPFWPYLFVLVAGVLATEVWRWAGVFIGGRVAENSAFIGWVRAVATALIAGVVAQLILAPSGSLAATPLGLRITASVVGLGAYLAARRNLFVGIAVAEAMLLGGWALLPGS
jgi:hypothetical protein